MTDAELETDADCVCEQAAIGVGVGIGIGIGRITQPSHLAARDRHPIRRRFRHPTSDRCQRTR
jgi:hypothetical protein